MYYESFLRLGRGVEPKPVFGEGYGSLAFGGRVHELLEEYYKQQVIYKPNANEKLEAEAQLVIDAYKAHYCADHWEILDVERTFKVALPGSNHVYIGKLDLFIRDLDDGKYYIVDHKTQKRGSKSHAPQKLATSDQASLYLWASRKVYPNYPIENFCYNILTRPSPAGREGPSFPDRYKEERNEKEISIAVRDITVIADQIETFTKTFGDNEWPANRQECYGWGYCDYYLIHRYGEDVSEILKHKYQPREEYLFTEGVNVIP